MIAFEFATLLVPLMRNGGASQDTPLAGPSVFALRLSSRRVRSTKSSQRVDDGRSAKPSWRLRGRVLFAERVSEAADPSEPLPARYRIGR
jgi:hypothetical protein